MEGGFLAIERANGHQTKYYMVIAKPDPAMMDEVGNLHIAFNGMHFNL